jgi:hypothetical protein
MLHSKTNTQYIGNKGEDPKKETPFGNIIITKTGFGEVVDQPGFFESTVGRAFAFSSRLPNLLTSAAVMNLIVQSPEFLTKEKVQGIYRTAASDPAFANSLTYQEKANKGSLYYIKSREMSHIIGPWIQIAPITIMEDGQEKPTELYFVAVPFFYGNVPGYGEQARKMMMVIGGHIYGEKEV